MEPRRGRDSIVVAQVYYPYYSPPAVAQFPHGSLNDVQTLQTNVAPYFSNGGTKNKHSKAEKSDTANASIHSIISETE